MVERHSQVREGFLVSGGMQPGILRAEVVSFDASNHQADVAPLEMPDSILGGVPVLEDCSADLLAAGDTVLVQRFADGHAVVLGPLGNKPGVPVSGYASDSTTRTFTAQSYTAYPGLSVSLPLNVASTLWILCAYNARASAVRSPAFAAAIHIGTSQQAPLSMAGFAAASTWRPCSLALRSGSALAAGTHTITLKVYVYNAGDTITCRYASLSAVAIPA